MTNCTSKPSPGERIPSLPTFGVSLASTVPGGRSAFRSRFPFESVVTTNCGPSIGVELVLSKCAWIVKVPAGPPGTGAPLKEVVNELRWTSSFTETAGLARKPWTKAPLESVYVPTIWLASFIAEILVDGVPGKVEGVAPGTSTVV